MLRHIVLFKFKEENKAQNVAVTKAMLDALPEKIAEIWHSETYVDVGVKSDNYDLMLVSDFEDAAALERYIIHPDHKAVGAFMVPVRESRSCVDIEL